MSKVFTIADGLENLGALRTGGQGSVYKGRRVGAIYSAIKLIPTPIHTADETDKNYRSFYNEVTKLQKVNENPNPHVVKILSWGITDSGSFPFIEMEYIEGPDLCELLQPPHPPVFPIKELLKVADQLANALAHCHQVGVKHGDIKSNNVKYNVHTGNFILLDFGLAIMSEEQRRTSIRHAGAIEFMAPEQHDGKMLLQTDIYSYGVILYELLAGQVPFPLHTGGESGRNAVMLGHMEGDIPDAMQLRKQHLASLDDEQLNREMQVPLWLLKIIQRCLKKNPEERFANGMELSRAIANGALLTEQPPQGVLPEQKDLSALLRQTTEENVQLKQELATLRPLALKTGLSDEGATYKDENFVHLPKAVFLGATGLLVLALAFAIYGLFADKKAVVTQPEATKSTYEAPFVTYNRLYIQRMQKIKEDSLRSARARQVEKERAAEQVWGKQEKKKKKKFLGIF